MPQWQAMSNRQIKLEMKLKQIILRLATYSKHWELPVIVKKGLLLPQLLILAQTLAEKMSDTSMTCQHKPTDLQDATGKHS